MTGEKTVSEMKDRFSEICKKIIFIKTVRTEDHLGTFPSSQKKFQEARETEEYP